jgi:hypothetical protein
MSPLGKLVSLVRPRKIALRSPVIGLLNLLGAKGDAMVREDREHLAPLFVNVKTSGGIVPYCHVLFIYADIDVAGQFVGSPLNLADIVNGGNATIVVVASPNDAEAIEHCTRAKRTREANIVFTADRGHAVFGPYFAKLFRMMWDGTSMPQAWAELAPPQRSATFAAPAATLLAEAGHVVFQRPEPV